MDKHEKAILLGLAFVLIVATAVVFARRQRARVAHAHRRHRRRFILQTTQSHAQLA